MNKYILFLLVLFSASFAQAHNYHVSITHVNYNESSHSLQIEIKLFNDDFTRALNENREGKIVLEKGVESLTTDSLILNYLRENIQFQINNQTTTYQFIGKEVEEHDTWCYLEILNIENINTIKVMNSIFTNLFNDQQNRVNIKVGDKEQSVFLNSKKFSDSLEF